MIIGGFDVFGESYDKAGKRVADMVHQHIADSREKILDFFKGAPLMTIEKFAVWGHSEIDPSAYVASMRDANGKWYRAADVELYLEEIRATLVQNLLLGSLEESIARVIDKIEQTLKNE